VVDLLLLALLPRLTDNRAGMADRENVPDASRREFVRVSLLVGLGAACAGAGVIPLLSQRSAAVGAPVPLISLETIAAAAGDLEALATPGKQVALEVTLTRRDAWRNITRAQTVYLSRVKPGSTADCFAALSPICPHAGCAVVYKEGAFACPCHDAKFDAKGARKAGPSPRDLDSLTLSIAPIDGKPWLHLTWQDFITGIEQRIART